MSTDDFYCRYYVGHKGKFGHEYMEFEITSDGRLRYANNSNYKNDTMIRKEGKTLALIVSCKSSATFPLSILIQNSLMCVISQAEPIGY